MGETEAPHTSRLWRHADFLRLWVGQTVSLFGSRITLVALPLTAVFTLHASSLEMGLLVATQAVPSLVFGLLTGVWIDRLRHRPLMIAADIGRALILLSLPIAALTGSLTLVQLFVVALLLASLTLIFDVAYQSFLPSVIHVDDLVEGNSKLQMSESLAQVAGPGLGGALVQILTAPVALIADAASYLVSALCLTLIATPEPGPRRSERASILVEMREGIGVIAHTPTLWRLIASSATFNLFDNVLLAIYVLYMTHDLHIGAGGVGLIFGLGGIGGLVAAALVTRLTKAIGIGRAMLLGLICAALSELLIAGAGGTVLLAFFVLVVAEVGVEFGTTVYSIDATSLRQGITSDRLRGRVNATARTLVVGLGVFGAIAGGVLGQLITLRWTVLVAGIGTLSSLAWIASSPLRMMRR